MAINETVTTTLKVDNKQFLSGVSTASSSLGDLGDSVKEVNGSNFKKVGSNIKNVGDKFTGVSLAAGGLLAGIGAVGIEFETSFAKASTLLQGSTEDLKKVEEGILGISRETGIAATEISEGLYQALSAGVDQDLSLDFIENSTKLAKAGFTDLTSAVDATTSILNAYNLDASETERIQGILINTQNKGKTTVDELASSLSNVIPIASSTGVSFEDVGASLSAITAQGTPTAKATTQLNQLFAELGKEGSVANESFKEISGATFKDFVANGGNVQEALQLLSDGAEASGTDIANSFGSIEASQAALALTSESGAESFNEALASSATGAEQLDDALAKVEGTSGEELKTAFNELKIAGTELFSALAPFISSFASGISKVASIFTGLPGPIQKIIVGVLLFVAVLAPILIIVGSIISAISAIIPVVAAIGAAFSPIVLIIIGIGIVVGVVVFLIIKYWTQIKAFTIAVFTAIGNFIKSVFTGIWNFIKFVFGIIVTIIQTYINIYIAIFTFLLNVIITIFTAVWNFITFVFQIIVTIIQTAINVAVAIFTFLFNIIKTIFTGIWNFIKGVFNIIVSIIRGAINIGVAIFNTLKNTVTTVFNAIKSKVSTVFNAIKSTIVKVINKIIDKFNSIKDTVSNVVSSIKGFFTGIFDGFLDTIDSVKSGLSKLNPFSFGGLDASLLVTGATADAEAGSIINNTKSNVTNNNVNYMSKHTQAQSISLVKKGVVY